MPPEIACWAFQELLDRVIGRWGPAGRSARDGDGHDIGLQVRLELGYKLAGRPLATSLLFSDAEGREYLVENILRRRLSR